MRLLFAAAGAASVLAIASPTAAQAQNVQQLLKGLTTGNQSQDQALHDAFERGYRKGRQDEAQAERSGRGESNNRGYQQSSPNGNYSNGNDADRNQPSYGNQGYNGNGNQGYNGNGR